MIVDKTGKPSDLKIIQSAGAGVDASVLAAVSQYRFTPGMVSNQPIATPLNLEVVISNTCIGKSLPARAAVQNKTGGSKKLRPFASCSDHDTFRTICHRIAILPQSSGLSAV